MRKFLLFLALAAVGIQSAAAQSIVADPTPLVERSPFSVGIYAGELYKSKFISLFYRPQGIDLSPSYLVAANFDYRFYKFASLPIQFEGEFDIAKGYDGADEVDFALAPFVRWMSFPWNRTVYTNVRLGILGLSYATGISAWERQNSGNSTGSRFLNFLVPEVTFASSENSPWEAFLRVHHRSGGYGLFNGVYGGSNYLACGFRVFW